MPKKAVARRKRQRDLLRFWFEQVLASVLTVVSQQLGQVEDLELQKALTAETERLND